jgi:hypothetical protein
VVSWAFPSLVRGPLWLRFTCVTPVLVTKFATEEGNAWTGEAVSTIDDQRFSALCCRGAGRLLSGAGRGVQVPPVCVDHELSRCSSAYTLRAVTFHQGVSARHGHYFAVVRADLRQQRQRHAESQSHDDSQSQRPGPEGLPSESAGDEEEEVMWVELNDAFAGKCARTPQQVGADTTC